MSRRSYWAPGPGNICGMVRKYDIFQVLSYNVAMIVLDDGAFVTLDHLQER
jgi:hypothetical protein